MFAVVSEMSKSWMFWRRGQLLAISWAVSRTLGKRPTESSVVEVFGMPFVQFPRSSAYFLLWQQIMVYRPCSTWSLNGFTASRPSNLSDAAFTVALATQIPEVFSGHDRLSDYVVKSQKRTELCGAEVLFLITNADVSFFESVCISCTAEFGLCWSWQLLNVLVPKDISFVVHTACKLLSRFTGFSWPVFGTQPWAQTPRKAAMFCKTCLTLGIAFTPARWKLQTLCHLHSVGFFVLKNTSNISILKPFSDSALHISRKL